MIEIEILISVRFKKSFRQESAKVVSVTRNTEGSTSQRVLCNWPDVYGYKICFGKLNGIFKLFENFMQKTI